MKTLSVDEQVAGFLYACRARMAIRDAKPCDPEALASIGMVIALVAPEHSDLNAWERQHGVPLTSAETYSSAVALVGSDITAAPRPSEVQH